MKFGLFANLRIGAILNCSSNSSMSPIEVNCLQNFVAAAFWAEYKKERVVLRVRRKDLASILIVDMGF